MATNLFSVVWKFTTCWFFWRALPRYQIWSRVCFSADTYMANREWGPPMPISACNDREGWRRDGLSPLPLFCLLPSSLTAKCIRVSYFLVTAYIEKGRWELLKNPTSYIEQILKAISHKTAAVWPPTSNIKKNNQINRTRHRETLLEKERRSHKRRSPMDPFTRTCNCWMTKSNLSTTALYGHRM